MAWLKEPQRTSDWIREDVQAAIWAIGTRSDGDIEIEKKENFDLVLTDADLTNADMTDANLVGAELDDAKLVEADLDDAKLVEADLTGADLSKVKGLTQYQLDQACADPDNPPSLAGVHDAKTNKRLKWHGKPCKK